MEQVVSRVGTPAPKPSSYSVGSKGFVLTKSKVAATTLRDQLQVSAATMACLIEGEAPGVARRDSECALKILHLLKECFVEIGSYKYEVGLPSHKWVKVAGLDTKLLLQLASDSAQVIKEDPTLVRLEPPVYVVGDLHGNFKDFAYFAKAFGLWNSAEFVPARFLFLGDYVDRGLHSIETLAFVLALKVRFPDKIFLLRGEIFIFPLCFHSRSPADDFPPSTFQGITSVPKVCLILFSPVSVSKRSIHREKTSQSTETKTFISLGVSRHN